MGCIQAKCCRHSSPSSEGDNRDEMGIFPDQNPLLANSFLEVVEVPSHNLRLSYSAITQTGYYPETPGRQNQDSFCIKTSIQENPNVHFFSVFDGHGEFGSQCSIYVRDKLIQILSQNEALLDDPIKAYSQAFSTTNEELHRSKIDDSMSGTTAITVLVIGDKLYVANVGDSRVVLAAKEGEHISSRDLSWDQTPFREDECERVKGCGARVLSVDQVEGVKDPGVQSWGDEETDGGDPPRVWVQDGMFPGTAFTRSVGDGMAEKIGVVADPEVSVLKIMESYPFFVVASDGVDKYGDPRYACAAIVG